MDTVGNFLSQIRNAYLADKDEVIASYSKLRKSLADLLVKEGYLLKVETKKLKDNKANLRILLNYIDGDRPAISRIKRMSKPGRRLYATVGKIPWTLGGLGLAIVSTPKGLMTDKQARKNNLGGEIICKIYP